MLFGSLGCFVYSVNACFFVCFPLCLQNVFLLLACFSVCFHLRFVCFVRFICVCVSVDVVCVPFELP